MSKLHFVRTRHPVSEIQKIAPGVEFHLNAAIACILDIHLVEVDGPDPKFEFLSLQDDALLEQFQEEQKKWEAKEPDKRKPEPPSPPHGPSMMYLPLQGEPVEARRVPKGECWMAGEYVFFVVSEPGVGGLFGNLFGF